MKKLLIASLAVVAAGANAQLWKNGSMVTHPGAGPSGEDVSMADLANNIAGNNMRQFGVEQFTMADDFTVGGPGWSISSIRAYGYETGAFTPGWTGVTMNILDGMPGVGNVVATSTSFALSFANVNRVFNGAANLTNTQRRVHAIDMTFANEVLAAGDYWFTIQVVGGASGWYPHVMEPDPTGGTNTFTPDGNAMIHDGVAWAPVNIAPVGANPKTVGIPFIIEGSVVPEPGTFVAIGLGLAGLALARRRR